MRPLGSVWYEIDVETERDQLFGGGGSDRLTIGYGDDADGGDGNNTLWLSLIGSPTAITVDLMNQTVSPFSIGGGTISNIQQVAVLWGSNFGDTLAGAGAIYAMGGDDTINGSLSGVPTGVHTNQLLSFSQIIGSFAFTNSGIVALESLRGSGSSATFYFHSGGNELDLTGISGVVVGNHGIDTIRGSAFTDIFYGAGGNDLIDGRGGDDELQGGAGNDYVLGGDGDDALFGGNGARGEGDDTLDGGAGNDPRTAAGAHSNRSAVRASRCAR